MLIAGSLSLGIGDERWTKEGRLINDKDVSATN